MADHSRHVQRVETRRSPERCRALRGMMFSFGLTAWIVLRCTDASLQAAPPSVPGNLQASDHPWDGGKVIDLQWTVPEAHDDRPIPKFQILRSSEPDGWYRPVELIEPQPNSLRNGVARYAVGDCKTDEDYYLRVIAIGENGEKSVPADFGPVRATRQWFEGSRLWLGIITAALGGAVIYWIYHARQGRDLKVRKIAGLSAIDEAVGRATEMGRACLFIPGIQDMNDIQTIAGITVLSRVAKTAAEYDAQIEVPTSRSLVMTTAREAVQASYLAAGRPDAFNEDQIYYVTDEQFGYVAYLSGMMVREKPAACFYMGSFFAESLILAETGNAIGAIQVAGTAQPAQLPFFVAACDYTLIGEELFAASAYLSGEPEQLGSLKGQDVGKLLVAALIFIGCGIATLAAITPSPTLDRALAFLQQTVLR